MNKSSAKVQKTIEISKKNCTFAHKKVKNNKNDERNLYNPSIGIEQHIHDAGMTQKQLGEEVLVSASMINQIENGKKGVSRDLIKDIAEVLGIPARELL